MGLFRLSAEVLAAIEPCALDLRGVLSGDGHGLEVEDERVNSLTGVSPWGHHSIAAKDRPHAFRQRR